MGTYLIEIYHNNIKKKWKLAFKFTFVICLLVHFYKFTNFLPNHDSFYNVYSNQNMTISGRWFLQYACGISSYFDLPWLNGLLCAFFLGITAAVIIELFDVENPFVIGLTGAVLASCPSATETLFFGFTADGYLMGLMLAAFAALLSANNSSRKTNVFSGICLCIVLAIYQAYISFAIVLSACYLVNSLLNQKINLRDAWKWISRHVVIYVCSAAAYYAIWKAILMFTGQTATTYQGISTVGKIQISTLISGAVKSVRNLFFFFLEWNIFEHPITLYGFLNIIFLFAFFGILFVAILKSKVYQNCNRLLLIIAVMGACVPAVSIWCFLSDSVQYRPMMLHSAVVFYIFALVLFDKWVNTKISTIFALLISIMAFNFSVMANISYFYLDKCYEKSYYIGSQMIEKIDEITETESEVREIAFIGNRADEVAITPDFPGNRIHILSSLLEEDLLYDHVHAYLFLRETFDLDIAQSDAETRAILEYNPVVTDMGIWPASNSVEIINGVLVIKLADPQN